MYKVGFPAAISQQISLLFRVVHHLKLNGELLFCSNLIPEFEMR